MTALRFLVWVTVAAGLIGCVSATPQTDQVLKNPPAIPKQTEIANVPFINQSAGYCGPATLAMAMAWAGKPVAMNDIAPEVFTKKMKGTLQQDLITASRRHGFTAIPIEGITALLTEVANGHPVIIFENLGFNWYQQWHYALVFGYDLDRREAILHSGPEASKHWELQRLERSWEYGDYWGLVVLPPGQLSTTATELDHLNAAAGLERVEQVAAAEASYASILKKWPESLAALIGMGNLTYNRGDRTAAIVYLKRAVKLHPSSTVARHNLAIAAGKSL